MMNDTDILLRRGLLLEYITLGWNVVGTVIVRTAAIAAHLVALAGFGLDSLVEIDADPPIGSVVLSPAEACLSGRTLIQGN